MATSICPECEKEFTYVLADSTKNRKQGKTGPFCSRRCAGTWSNKVKLSKKILNQNQHTHHSSGNESG